MATKWKRTTEADYWNALEALPPRVMCNRGFLLGEPYSTRKCQVTGAETETWWAYLELKVGEKKQWFASREAMTVDEFRAVKREDVVSEKATATA